MFITLLAIHLLGLVLGFGNAIVADLVSLRVLHGGQLTEEYNDILRLNSRLIWVGWLLLVGSGVGMVGYALINFASYAIPAYIIVKFILAMIIGLNGLLIAGKLHPAMNASIGLPLKNSPLWLEARRATTSGAISFTTRSSVFLISIFERTVAFSTSDYLMIYFALIVIAVGVSQLMFVRWKAAYLN